MSAPTHETRGPFLWASAVVGWAIVAFGVWTLFQRAGATHPLNFAVLFLGLALVHDLVVAPVSSLVGRLAGRSLPGGVRAIVFVAAVTSGALVLIALPPLLGDPGRNTSLLPRNEALGLAISLGVVWGAAIVAVVFRRRRRR